MRKKVKFVSIVVGLFVWTAAVDAQVKEMDDWRLVAYSFSRLNNYSIEDKEVTISIDTKEGRVSGNSGCNRFMGPFKFEESGRLAVGPFAGTLIACPRIDERFERLFRETLASVDAFSYENGVLTFRDNETQNFMRFQRIVKPEILTWYVNKDVVDCVGVVKTKCLQIKDNKASAWQNFFGPIEGFNFKKGRFYLIEVERKKRENPPADASVYSHRLVRIVKEVKKEKDL